MPFTEPNGNIKKNALEAASYGVAYAEKTGVSAKGIVIGKIADEEIKKVGSVGLEKVIKVDGLDYLNHQKSLHFLKNKLVNVI